MNIHLVHDLRTSHTLTATGYHDLLVCHEPDVCEYLRCSAQEVAQKVFGNKIFIRGLLEISNYCKNDCFYCGLRRSNISLQRYRLSVDEILSCCKTGYALGFRTFVLQGGEDFAQNDAWVEQLVGQLRSLFPDCAITLSLGEKSREAYARFRAAGADRYLLRHETFNAHHYALLHPSDMSYTHRMQCLEWLKDLGYQAGCGMMVGSPGQTVDHLVEDLLFIQRFQPAMVGIGPFIPHPATPFAHESAGSISMTLKLLSIIRLMIPTVLLPATTALSTVSSDGHISGIQAGANVIMPNLSPLRVRPMYQIYAHKACLNTEAAEGLAALQKELAGIGYEVTVDRGDYEEHRSSA